ncbi:glycine--tRNA ligase subunit beta [Piscinibacter sp.]|uniref:glycine--tRNA ligase subunit beta n=1 Tax=Piscinibacter sp. TaxID=1903157 RepID=UPI002B822953|nr:glycine--tRNA ligase subunit beta [Albitalea sp.]HUG24745.1 glycine--tRNA ligase subunit beta [Albitalea sp.]
MTATKNLLVEVFVEELPPKALKKLSESFAGGVAESLRAQGLVSAGATVMPFASPRRLGVHIGGVASAAADRSVSQKLMPASVGLAADGQPTPALLKKLAALGADASAVPSLKRQMDGKAEALFLDSVVQGATLADGLQKAVEEAIARLPIPKVMQYQLADGWTSVNFVRPAHGLVALHGADVVPIGVLGLHSGRSTQGHRFEAVKVAIELRDADSYEAQLRDDGAVIASFAERRAEIVRQLDAAAAREGLRPIPDEALLDEVTALVERPNVLLCRFDAAFLDVPQECLILTMKANQKYFPLLDANGKLTDRFLIVSNIRPADPSRVIEGNERVVRPRLADAKFFFDQDRKKTLASRVAGLAKVVYHNKLGTQGERVERVRAIARAIAQQLGGDALAAQADQAAMLAKADLLTDMVGEFPELQGTMGRYYARHDGLADDVALAIEDHYKPRFAGDELPRNACGVAVALADKLETLAGLFGIGQVPTGDKDPFALRRHALGLIRMLIERALPLNPAELVSAAFKAFPENHGQAQAEVGFFLRERLVGYLRDAGYSAQEVEAAIEARPEHWADFPKRLQAVRAFKALPEAEALAAANKRVGNILKKSDGSVAPVVDASLLAEPAEQALHEALKAVAPASEAAFAAGDYTASLQALAALKAPVDSFFDQVMVNTDDPALRANRLGLLAQLHAAMNRVADLSKLAS